MLLGRLERVRALPAGQETPVAEWWRAAAAVTQRGGMQQDVSGVRRAEVIHGFTPATELAAAVRALAVESSSGDLRWWQDLVVARVGAGALELLSALAAPGGELPLVLDPSAAAERSLEPGLAAIADTPAARIREGVEHAHGGALPRSRALRSALVRGDAGAVIARALWECWRLTLRPEWPAVELALRVEARDLEASIRRDGVLAALERVGVAHGSASLAVSTPVLALAPSLLEPAAARLTRADVGGWRLTYRASHPQVPGLASGREVPHPAR